MSCLAELTTGGGYIVPLDAGYANFWHDLLPSINTSSSNPKLAVFILNYTLAPHATHPTQLRQAAAALNYLLSIRSASNLFLAGDSAGGHLTLALLSHLRHPEPSAPSVSLPAGEKLAGAIVISPWTGSLPESDPSATSNAHVDIISAFGASKWLAAYEGSAPKDNYSHPEDAPADWWSGLPVRDVLFVIGADEVLRDRGVALAEKFKGAHDGGSTEILVAHKECHVAMILEKNNGCDWEFESGKVTKNWLLERV